MTTRYPATGIDDSSTLPNPNATNTTNSPTHAGQHANANDAIKALETKLGTGASVPAANTLLIGTGAGTSAFSAVTSAQLAASISDETGSGSAVFANTPTLITPKMDTIQEATPGNGVTVAGVNMKGGSIASGAIGANSLDASKVKWSATGANAGIWWEELGRTTLSSASTTLVLSSFPARKYLRVMIATTSAAATGLALTFNSDSGANYGFQWNTINGTGNSTGTSVSTTYFNLLPQNSATGDMTWGNFDIFNPSGAPKLINGSQQVVGTVASVPDPAQNLFGHWVNTTQVTTLTVTGSANTIGIGSEIVVLGHN